MKKIILLNGIVLLLVTGFVFVWSESPLWSEDAPPKPKIGRDLQVLSFNSKTELRQYMKELTKSLGVDCKFCHDLTQPLEMNVEGLYKQKAREMMIMVKGINLTYFKEKEEKMTCFTCHHGQKVPISSSVEWDKLQEEFEENN